ncbi:proteinase inhibitor I78 [Streptomyces sp. P38-E01]|uniref:Proteinase inhibitor I78 n=1 Tax=Streptomyces tardus TaxID=2780544 RepID=A0A949JGX2_9ACTN|nr:I78 family peptidase inhibitor [Streptomyces tardus]MBU7599792.1 proteinase inhibitor I78 [Streptomyces tardus]
MDDRPAEPTERTDDPEAYVGLPGGQAEEQARSRGWANVRSLPPGAMITMEYVEGRLNFTVEDEKVVRCWQG